MALDIMKCFYHQNVDAVAICKSCGCGLCGACVTKVGLSCSCRGECENVVAVLDDLVEKAIISHEKALISHATVQRLYDANSRMYFLFGNGMGLIGLVLAAVAGWCFMESQVAQGMRRAALLREGWALTAVAVFLLLVSGLFFWWAKQLRRFRQAGKEGRR